MWLVEACNGFPILIMEGICFLYNAWLIGNFDYCEKMGLHAIDDKALSFPLDKRNTCSPPLPRVRLLKVKIDAPTTKQVRELKESLKWMAPSLTCFSIEHK